NCCQGAPANDTRPSTLALLKVWLERIWPPASVSTLPFTLADSGPPPAQSQELLTQPAPADVPLKSVSNGGGDPSAGTMSSALSANCELTAPALLSWRASRPSVTCTITCAAVP